jgi:hypothetical protein
MLYYIYAYFKPNLQDIINPQILILEGSKTFSVFLSWKKELHMKKKPNLMYFGMCGPCEGY